MGGETWVASSGERQSGKACGALQVLPPQPSHLQHLNVLSLRMYRRIERLLILHPTADAGAPIGSLSTGLLILSLTRLRSYALEYLPMRVQTPFLEDLGDLEDTSLDREVKLRIVDRMWRCWGAGGQGIIVA